MGQSFLSSAKITHKCGNSIDMLLLCAFERNGYAWYGYACHGYACHGYALESQAVFPEVMRRIIVVNPPLVFSALFALVKPFLFKRVLDKIVVAPRGDPHVRPRRGAALQPFLPHFHH